ncbi:dTDP-4-dehydrorhamnose reductase [Phenylobacterium soli]|uniref:dTDP-4-dehydrorhamnose reductase n=1 Tax=Phenylobacterium soli TaxID=2170551 RepID=A0A328AG98_9CAUL|nr:dTDP-4-dehydrorhamnose reductase [Phenylobacterium soli]RAK53750.1 dTDP-4-dehydrorhamnose reductase [Phenylobacterium soli]
MSLRILQFGKTGQLATELRRRAVEDGLALSALSHAEADFADPEGCAAQVGAHAPDLVVIAAAYTAVDQAESERELALRINAETPGAIAAAADKAGAAVVHVSTDYVFDGEKGAPYVETDPTNPLNVYGASKLAGEAAVLEACARATVLRTSWVVSAHGKNFVKTMLRVAAEGHPLKVVDDQFGRPTAAGDLAQFILDQTARLTVSAGDPAFGLFHFANAGEVSWKGFAEAIFEEALGEAAPRVEAIRTADRPSPARRPLRGTLDTTRLERVFGYSPRPWRTALAEIIDELKVTS